MLAHELKENEDVLSRLVVVPNPQFPIHTQYMIAEHLLQTNTPLPVQEWIESGKEYAREAVQEELLSDFDRRKIWYDAPRAALAQARKQKWGADYTLAEVQAGIETIETGLRRKLVEPPLDDDDDEEFEDEEEEGEEEDSESMEVDPITNAGTTTTTADVSASVPPMSLDVMMRFMSMAKDG
ncbi:uncharacterized protein HMPREF1541_06464 [Cyphellophora europaea CBS 101466]|uniref:Mediator of RNA polymerase II transcription subunit 8 n=1 Tax=Cyphellophora europaea (strain CBS 101466) TaxID=1220924 RepID=W2RRV0_CYPE1|nr:uncharacterized protein HMPREF1541_06464 [Cyphellophora europaea CBS 101466]ETN38429.1 hypothetical protein HMPREF1541_06464 [Cyphellophora europaea CBS 101466]